MPFGFKTASRPCPLKPGSLSGDHVFGSPQTLALPCWCRCDGNLMSVSLGRWRSPVDVDCLATWRTGREKQASIPQRQRRCMLGTWANISDRETCSWPRRNICHLSNRGLISNIWNIITLHFGELEKVAYFQLSDLDPIPVFLLNLRNEAKSHLHSNGVGAKQNHSMNSMAG